MAKRRTHNGAQTKANKSESPAEQDEKIAKDTQSAVDRANQPFQKINTCIRGVRRCACAQETYGLKVCRIGHSTLANTAVTQ